MPHRSGLLIIQAGTPPDPIRACHGEPSEWFCRALGLSLDAVTVVRPFLDEDLPPPSRIGAAIITGSWAMVSDREPWSERTAAWIRTAMQADRALLGVCYGHQLMAHALGGRVDYHPKGREIGQLPVTLLPAAQGDPLVGRLPASFIATLTHEQTVLEPPPGAAVLARSAHDPHQILRYGRHALSVQFHPEFTAAMLASCLQRRADHFTSEGFDVPALLGALGETPAATGLLRDFVAAYRTVPA